MLNANTGLIGMPQQTMGAGVNVRCLINPNIKLGGLIRLDQASVYRQALGNDQVGPVTGLLGESTTDGNIYVDGLPGSQLAAINTDGDYIVGSIDYTGDTRGQAWYMDLLCLAKGAENCKAFEHFKQGWLMKKIRNIFGLWVVLFLLLFLPLQCGPFS